ncbi:hypothetical protein [Mucilaginibacter antarcticus]|uniref:hypothetical protein n=1 Tax=Mucilaginibacter antarcticus TaxID=1855725 RepID=UPI00362B7AE2
MGNADSYRAAKKRQQDKALIKAHDGKIIELVVWLLEKSKITNNAGNYNQYQI